MRIILASKSSARKKILEDLGLKFEVVPSEVDEDTIKNKRPAVLVKKIAMLKARTVLKKVSWLTGLRINESYGLIKRRQEQVLIIAADTVVYIPKSSLYPLSFCGQAKIIGKPKDKTDAKQILKSLSGSTHYLYTGICAISLTSGKIDKEFCDFEKTKVVFRKLKESEINQYIENPEVLNHAGTYTIEKSTPGAGFIKKIEGSYTNVLGLPVEKLRKIFKGIKVLRY